MSTALPERVIPLLVEAMKELKAENDHKKLASGR